MVKNKERDLYKILILVTGMCVRIYQVLQNAGNLMFTS